jgi:DNA polymerase I-like protein with 3'-5' exonuclease and polymerase domains
MTNKNHQYHFLDQDIKDMSWGNIDLDWSPPNTFPDLTKSSRIAIDLETKDPNLIKLGPGWCRKDGHVIGIAIAAGDFQGYYPIRHSSGNLDSKLVLRWLKDQMNTPDIPKVFHNALYDLGWLRAEGIEVKGSIIDTMIMAPLINENRRFYNLNSLVSDYLQEFKSEKTLRSAANEFGVDPKAEMYKLPAKYVGAYAEKDAGVTLRLCDHLMPILEKEECVSIFKLESSLIPVILDMKTRGVRVDVDEAEKTKKQMAQQEKKLLDEITKDTGIAIEPWVSTSIAKVFDFFGLQYSRTEKSRSPSFTKQFLSNHSHPVAKKIVKIRELNKANTTFVETILNHAHNGRIHCDFHPLRTDDGGTVTGRFSSSNPNLQQIPTRDLEIKKAIRGLFIPEEKCKWGSFDYASQEPRWLAHYCANAGESYRHYLIDEVVTMYKEGKADFHQMVADMAKISRKEAKTVNLGIMYGMGRKKLADTLAITEEEAIELLNTYNQKVPFVKDLATRVSNFAQEKGMIRTHSGRKCRFDMWEPKGFGVKRALPLEQAVKEYQNIQRAFTYKALNRLIQGSSADQTKKAMVDCYSEGLCPMLTVHDELCFNIENDEQVKKIKEIMTTCIPDLNIPFEVDVELGQNWGEVG